MEFNDRVLRCVRCGEEFIFTAEEQSFFCDKQFRNDPKRCKRCRAKGPNGLLPANAETRATCAVCGRDTTVPFRPTQGRPVLCRTCFEERKAATTVPTARLVSGENF
ncbi:MAG: zinc-ribbon domain containing protein [Acidobacteriota bacterium]